jgi:hypothetical protein
MRSRPRLVPRGSCPVRPRLRFASDRDDVIYANDGRVDFIESDDGRDRAEVDALGISEEASWQTNQFCPISSRIRRPTGRRVGATRDASWDFLLFARVRAYTCGVRPARMAGTLHDSVYTAGGLAFMTEFHADPSQVAANQLDGRDLPWRGGHRLSPRPSPLELKGAHRGAPSLLAAHPPAAWLPTVLAQAASRIRVRAQKKEPAPQRDRLLSQGRSAPSVGVFAPAPQRRCALTSQCRAARRHSQNCARRHVSTALWSALRSGPPPAARGRPRPDRCSACSAPTPP